MAINYMPNIAAVASINLGVTVDKSGDYELIFAPQELSVGYEIKLKDNYLNTIIPLAADGIVDKFAVNKTTAASSGMNRFEILNNPLTTLPVVISSFNAAKTNEGVSLKWTTSTANNHSHFIMQRAGDDKVYTDAALVQAKQAGICQILDKTPLIGYNYYRLVQVDQDAKTTTTDPVVIKYELNGVSVSGILVYPTITDAKYTLKYNGALFSAVYELKITDLTGKNIWREKLQKSTLVNGYQGMLTGVATGIYFVEVIDNFTGKSLGVTKLIKRYRFLLYFIFCTILVYC